MAGIAFARKLAATTVAAIACGGVAWASAAVVPAHGGPHRAGAESETTVDPGSSTTTDAGASTTTIDDSTTTTVEAGTTTTTGATTTSTEPETTTTVGGSTPSVPCNHGEDVSRVAHTASRGQEGPPGAHGAAVSAVAHEKCADAGDHDDDSTSGQAPKDDGSPSPSAQGRSHQHVKIRSGRSDS
jgi:hypothetical protein